MSQDSMSPSSADEAKQNLLDRLDELDMSSLSQITAGTKGDWLKIIWSKVTKSAA
jgi:hypothetical protein